MFRLLARGRNCRLPRRALYLVSALGTTSFCEGEKGNSDVGSILNNLKKRGAEAAESAKELMGSGAVTEDYWEKMKSNFTAEVPAQVGFGFVMGFTSGFALKNVGKVVGFAVGVAFVGLQGLAHLGFIVVDYDKLGATVTSILDRNGDGKIDRDDVEAAFESVKKVVGFSLPSEGGFAAGLLLGLR